MARQPGQEGTGGCPSGAGNWWVDQWHTGHARQAIISTVFHVPDKALCTSLVVCKWYILFRVCRLRADGAENVGDGNRWGDNGNTAIVALAIRGGAIAVAGSDAGISADDILPQSVAVRKKGGPGRAR